MTNGFKHLKPHAESVDLRAKVHCLVTWWGSKSSYRTGSTNDICAKIGCMRVCNVPPPPGINFDPRILVAVCSLDVIYTPYSEKNAIYRCRPRADSGQENQCVPRHDLPESYAIHNNKQ